MTVHLTPASDRLRRTLVCGALALVAAHLALCVLNYEFGHDHVFGLARLFNVDGEQNVPAFYSALQLLACGALLALVAAGARARGDRYAAHWAWLALLFGFLSVDEMTSVHELFAGRAQLAADPTAATLWGRLGWSAWVLPYAALTTAVGAAYVPFLRDLPRATRVRFVASGAAFVGAAVGVELVECLVAAAGPTSPWARVAVTSAQEAGEMLAIAYFLGAVLRHFEDTEGPLEIRFASAGVRVPGRHLPAPGA